MSYTIDAEAFKKATGTDPVDDDLERSNCPEAGKVGHWACGWDHDANLPIFMSPEGMHKQMRKPTHA